MKYVAFFAIVISFQLLLLVSVLRIIRRRRAGGDSESLLRLTSKVFLLMLAVNIIGIIPGIGLASLVIWLVGLVRLSGLDVLSAFLLSFTTGVVSFAVMVVLARYLELSFLGT